jgi:chaperonin cofactor prefoldin
MKDNVFRRLDELRRAISQDRFDLSRNDQESIEFRLEELKQYIQSKYAQSGSESN